MLLRSIFSKHSRRRLHVFEEKSANFICHFSPSFMEEALMAFIIEDCDHYPMLEKSEKFNAIIQDIASEVF